jgi:glyoxylase-like metal-dependent hydrolase (beta-lactamase superfamily II)
MITLASGIEYVDLNFQGYERVIATAVLHGADGVTLIDPGPSSCLDVLEADLARRGMSFQDVTAILLTHIHFDHAGAAGTIVRANPKVTVYVHQRGLPHLAAPERLLESATRLYGHDLGRLFGELLPVPIANLRSLEGGERLELAGRRLEVAYTPGHALHHVSYFEADSGVAFIGDVGSIRRGPDDFILPPTPPPDIDLEAWRASIATIEEWQPGTLFVTHFGPYTDVRTHFQGLLDRLDSNADLARAILLRGGSDTAQAEEFRTELRRIMRQTLREVDVDAYEIAGFFGFSYQGLARYWKKKVKSGEVESRK